MPLDPREDRTNAIRGLDSGIFVFRSRRVVIPKLRRFVFTLENSSFTAERNRSSAVHKTPFFLPLVSWSEILKRNRESPHSVDRFPNFFFPQRNSVGQKFRMPQTTTKETTILQVSALFRPVHGGHEMFQRFSPKREKCSAKACEMNSDATR